MKTSGNHEALPGWRPTSLRKTTLLGFALVSVACIVALAVLFAFSHAHNGLCTVDMNLHYLWTYVPTLFFTICGACWSRVAYRVLQMQPWRMILRANGSMSEALLVDYVTPIPLASLFKAIKAKHLLVAMALLTTMSLQLITVLSTSLFGIEYLLLQRDVTIRLLDSITGVDHDFSAVGGGPDLTIYSIQNTNLTFPEGTTSLHAVPRLSYPQDSNATLNAPLEVFTSDLQCELASFYVDHLTQTSPNGIHFGPEFTYSLWTTDCFIPNQTVTGGLYLDYNYPGLNFNFSDTYGNVDAVTCSSNKSDVRIRISVGLIHYNITWNGTAEDTNVRLPSSLSDIYSLPAATNLLCIPQYGLQKAEVTYTTQQTTGSRQVQVQLSDSKSLQAVQGITSDKLTNAILGSVSETTLAIGALFPNPNVNVIVVNGPSESEGGYFPTNADAFFMTMTQGYPLVNGSIKSTWFDSAMLQNASSKFFASVAAQFASQYLRKDDNSIVIGSAEVTKPRLVALSAAFYAIEAFLGIFVLGALGIAWSASKIVSPIDPTSIGGTTAMLCSDGKLIDRFRGTGSWSLSQLRCHLLGADQSNRRIESPHTYGSRGKSESIGDQIIDMESEESSWWRAFVFRPLLREIILVIPLVVIAALELTLHISQNHNGLISVGSNRYEVYAMRLVPAAVFFAIEMLLQTVAFNVSLLTPLSKMRREPCAARMGLFDTPLARFPLQNLWASAGKGRIALFSSFIMTTTAFFLVTVSSGLFVTGAYTQPSNITLLSWFQPNFSNKNPSIQGVTTKYNLTKPLTYQGAEVTVHLISNAIIELNLSYPAWTYGELALPLFTLSDTYKSHATGGVSVSAEIPAMRAAIDCYVLKEDEMNITYQSYPYNSLGSNYTYQVGYVQSTLFQFQSCPRSNSVEIQAYLTPRLNTSEKGSSVARPCSSMGISCSNLTGIYGYATDEAFVNYSVISCKVSYEQVSTTAVLELPNYVISKNAQPRVDETPIKPVNSSDVNDFLNSVYYSALFYNTSLTTVNGIAMMDPVTTALIYGKDGVPAEQLFQRPPEEHLIPSLRSIVQVMAAQYMSYFYRTTNSSIPLVGSTVPVAVQMGPDYRLKQNIVSTRILDVLLAVSWLFAMLTVFTFRSHDVAKAKPGTLAATLALVADSEFVHNIQTDIQHDRSTEIRRKHTSVEKSTKAIQVEQQLRSEGYQFSLGWWDEMIRPPPISILTRPRTPRAITATTSSTSSSGDQKGATRRRWGIDIGRSE